MPKITKNSNLAPYSEFAALEAFNHAPDMAKVNKFTVAPLTEADVRIYSALLIDDQVTRNSTHYPADFQKNILSLPAGEGNFVGAPILFGDDKDHKEAAACQVGRIFDAWQVTDAKGHIGVMARFYVPKESHQELIGKIDSGVLKEVSISTKVELPICSICHQDIRTCGHTMGKEGCHVTMTGKGFCAEVSLVAVPGSSQAKILNPDAAAKYSPMEMLEAVKGLIKEELAKFAEAPMNINLMKDYYRKVGAGTVEMPKSMVDNMINQVADPKGKAVGSLVSDVKMDAAKVEAAKAIRDFRAGDAVSALGEGAAAKAKYGTEWAGRAGKMGARPGGDLAASVVKAGADVTGGTVTGAAGTVKAGATGLALGATKGLPGGAAGIAAGAAKGGAAGVLSNVGNAVKSFMSKPTPKSFGIGLGAGLTAFAIWEGGKAIINKIRDRKKGRTQESTEASFKEGMIGDFFKKLKDPGLEVTGAAGQAIKTAAPSGGTLANAGQAVLGAGKRTLGTLGKAVSAAIPRSIPGIVAYSAIGTAVSMGVSSLINKFVAKKQERDEEKRARRVTLQGMNAEALHTFKESFDEGEVELMSELGFKPEDVEAASDEEINELIEILQEFKGSLDAAASLTDDDKEILAHFGVTPEEMNDWTPAEVDELIAAFMDENGLSFDEQPKVKAEESFNPLALVAGALIGSLLYKAHKAKAEKEGKKDVPPVIINITGPTQSMAPAPMNQTVAVNPWRPIMSYRMTLNAADMFRESENSLVFTPDELTFLNAIGIDAKEASELTPEQLNALIAILEGHKAQIEGTPDEPGLTPVEEPVVKSTESLSEPVAAEISAVEQIGDKLSGLSDIILTLTGKYSVEPAMVSGVINKEDKFAYTDAIYSRMEAADNNLRKVEARVGITPELVAPFEDTGDNRKKIAYLTQKLDNITKRVYTLKGRIGVEDASRLELVRETVRVGVLAGVLKIGSQEAQEKLFSNMTMDEIRTAQKGFTEKAEMRFWKSEIVPAAPAVKLTDRELAKGVTKSK